MSSHFNFVHRPIQVYDRIITTYYDCYPETAVLVWLACMRSRTLAPLLGIDFQKPFTKHRAKHVSRNFLKLSIRGVFNHCYLTVMSAFLVLFCKWTQNLLYDDDDDADDDDDDDDDDSKQTAKVNAAVADYTFVRYFFPNRPKVTSNEHLKMNDPV